MRCKPKGILGSSRLKAILGASILIGTLGACIGLVLDVGAKFLTRNHP